MSAVVVAPTTAAIVKPGGNAPDEILYVIGGKPPVVDTEAKYDWPISPSGRVPLRRDSGADCG
jgi:hypothetical protein